jgi:hypothetical protein
MSEIRVSNSKLYSMLVARGYEVIITKHNDSKFVSFQGKYVKPYDLTFSYSLGWSEYEIK